MDKLVDVFCDVDDRKPVPELTKALAGKLYADKGYISKALSAQLFDNGIGFITGVRKNIKPKALSLWDKAMLKKRFIIETINEMIS